MFIYAWRRSGGIMFAWQQLIYCAVVYCESYFYYCFLDLISAACNAYLFYPSIIDERTPIGFIKYVRASGFITLLMFAGSVIAFSHAR